MSLGIGPSCFCCCQEFAALSRPSSWSSCEQRSLLYILCSLLPIHGRPLFKSQLHVTYTTHTDQKVLFMKIHVYKIQTNQMQASDPVFEASLQLVGDSNQQETSCERGSDSKYSWMPVAKNYHCECNLQGKCIRCLMPKPTVAPAYLKKRSLACANTLLAPLASTGRKKCDQIGKWARRNWNHGKPWDLASNLPPLS